MAGEAEIQVSRLLDERGLSAFQIKMLAWTILIGIIDGYDIGAIAFAAPHLCPEWHLHRSDLESCTDREQYRRPIRFPADGFHRRPLRPQDGADRLQSAVRCPDLCGGLFDRPDATVLATLLRRIRHRRRHSQPGRDQRRVVAAAIARDACHHRRRLCSNGRRIRRLRQRGACFALRLADPVSDWRRRAYPLCACGRVRSFGIDQVHGAARKPAVANGTD